jgi:hypothetical protein
METYKFKYGITGRIEHDDDAESPREWENLGKMVCWHRRYNLGDEQPRESPEEYQRRLAEAADPTVPDRIEYWNNGPGWVKIRNFYDLHPDADVSNPNLSSYYSKAAQQSDYRVQQIIDRALNEHYIILPLYLLDHSGISMSTGSFNDPWDSGQVGFIFVSVADAKKEWGWKVLTEKRRRHIEDILRGEVETYDQYLTGDVYGYILEGPDGEELDSCWGFFGEEYAIEEMNNVAIWHENEFAEQLANETQEEVEG